MGSIVTPAFTPQHMRALARANRVRLARAELKRQVANGEVHASEVVLLRPWQAKGMSVSELLTSQRRWGYARCRRLLLSIGVPENKPLGNLTDRQQMALATALSRRARRAPAVDSEFSSDRVLTAA